MSEPIIHHVQMIVVVEPAKVLSRHSLHLVNEGKGIGAIFLDQNGEPVGPLVNEEQGGPNVNTVMRRKRGIIID